MSSATLLLPSSPTPLRTLTYNYHHIQIYWIMSVNSVSFRSSNLWREVRVSRSHTNKNLQKSCGCLHPPLPRPPPPLSDLFWSVVLSEEEVRHRSPTLLVTCGKPTFVFSAEGRSWKRTCGAQGWVHCVTSSNIVNRRLPEVVVSWQNVYEENGQANVEQDHHADHYGVWALGKKKRNICGEWGQRELLCVTLKDWYHSHISALGMTA